MGFFYGLFLAFTCLASPLLDLEADLSINETKVHGIKPGQHKQFHWQNPKNPMVTEYSVIYLHGFSASLREISPTTEKVGQALMANVFFTRLHGHGIKGTEGLKDSRREDWQQDIAEAIQVGQKIGKKVVVIACSTSATLVVPWLKEHPQAVSKLILMSPNFGLPRWDAEFLLLPGARTWVEWVMGSYREYEPASPAQAEFWTTKYPYRATVEVMRSIQWFRQTKLNEFPIPVLVFYNPNDTVVDPLQIQKVFQQMKAPQQLLIPVTTAGDEHILAGEILSPQTTDLVVQEILNFVK